MMEAVAKKLVVKSSPMLRFGPFKEEWDMTLLGELARVTTGDKDTQNRKEGGQYPFFVRSDTIERIDTYSYEGKAILTSGDGVGVGKNFHYIDGRFDFHQRVYCICDFAPGVDAEFVYHYFSQAFYRRVMRMSAKNSVDSVRRDMVVEMPFPRPTHLEQQKIAAFLSAVDAKVRQLTRKQALLEQYKKGVMQQLFSRELRFKRKDGKAYPEWEVKRLGVVGGIITGKTPLTADADLWGGDIQFITPTDILENDKYQHTTQRYVQPHGKLKMLPPHSIVYTCIASIGKMAMTVHPAITNQQINAVVPNADISNEYIYYAMLHLTPSIKATQANTTLPIINKTEFSKIIVPVPSLEEQQRIAGFLMALDAKVEAVGKEVEAAQRWKKGLLQQMFV